MTLCMASFGLTPCHCLSTFYIVLLGSWLAYTSYLTSGSFDYADALSKSLLFLEAQRSGKLPESQRVMWRGDSALMDGHLENVDLTGGYYDAGDNVKFGFPMAFTVTVLSWATLENKAGFDSAGETPYVRDAIKWGTDYLLKASAEPMRLWVQVGDGEADHQCWQRPETMTTPRTAYQVNTSHPGTEVAAETAAAFAASSLVFSIIDANYSKLLLERATMLFDFARIYQASNTGECPFYCSYSGYQDELLWAATWLLKASGGNEYYQYVQEALPTAASKIEFSWDDKSAGAFVLLANHRYSEEDKTLETIAKAKADYFICSNLPGNDLTKVHKTIGGILHLREWANSQYAGGAAFLASLYADYVEQANQSSISCNSIQYTPQQMLRFAQSQVDYILGKNPLNMSYMVGFGKQWPTQLHHRGASIPTWYNPAKEVSCKEGYQLWFWSSSANPNQAVGAIVGGPDGNDAFQDERSNAAQVEPATYINALFTGVLARLHHLSQQQQL